MKSEPKKMGRRPGGSGPVYDWRMQTGLTQDEAAKRLGCGVATIKRCEGSGRAPAEYTVAGAKFQKLVAKTPPATPTA